MAEGYQLKLLGLGFAIRCLVGSRVFQSHPPDPNVMGGGDPLALAGEHPPRIYLEAIEMSLRGHLLKAEFAHKHGDLGISQNTIPT